MWELDHKEDWLPKNWCFQTVVLEKTLERSLDSKGIKSVHPEGDQSWIFISRTDAEAEAPILWSLDAKGRLNGKYPDAGKGWGQEEKWATEDETVGWHHWLNGYEFDQTLGDSEGQGSLTCCSPRHREELHAAEQQQHTVYKAYTYWHRYLKCYLLRCVVWWSLTLTNSESTSFHVNITIHNTLMAIRSSIVWTYQTLLILCTSFILVFWDFSLANSPQTGLSLALIIWQLL